MLNKAETEEQQLQTALEMLCDIRRGLERAVSESIAKGIELDHKRDLIEADSMKRRRKNMSIWSRWL